MGQARGTNSHLLPSCAQPQPWIRGVHPFQNNQFRCLQPPTSRCADSLSSPDGELSLFSSDTIFDRPEQCHGSSSDTVPHQPAFRDAIIICAGDCLLAPCLIPPGALGICTMHCCASPGSRKPAGRVLSQFQGQSATPVLRRGLQG